MDETNFRQWDAVGGLSLGIELGLQRHPVKGGLMKEQVRLDGPLFSRDVQVLRVRNETLGSLHRGWLCS